MEKSTIVIGLGILLLVGLVMIAYNSPDHDAKVKEIHAKMGFVAKSN